MAPIIKYVKSAFRPVKRAVRRMFRRQEVVYYCPPPGMTQHAEHYNGWWGKLEAIESSPGYQARRLRIRAYRERCEDESYAYHVGNRNRYELRRSSDSYFRGSPPPYEPDYARVLSPCQTASLLSGSDGQYPTIYISRDYWADDDVSDFSLDGTRAAAAATAPSNVLYSAYTTPPLRTVASSATAATHYYDCSADADVDADDERASINSRTSSEGRWVVLGSRDRDRRRTGTTIPQPNTTHTPHVVAARPPTPHPFAGMMRPTRNVAYLDDNEPCADEGYGGEAHITTKAETPTTPEAAGAAADKERRPTPFPSLTSSTTTTTTSTTLTNNGGGGGDRDEDPMALSSWWAGFRDYPELAGAIEEFFDLAYGDGGEQGRRMARDCLRDRPRARTT